MATTSLYWVRDATNNYFLRRLFHKGHDRVIKCLSLFPHLNFS